MIVGQDQEGMVSEVNGICTRYPTRWTIANTLDPVQYSTPLVGLNARHGPLRQTRRPAEV